MNAKLMTRVQLFNAIIAAIFWSVALLFAIGYTGYRIIRSEQMGAVDFVVPCFLTAVVIVSIRRYVLFHALHKAASESVVVDPPWIQPRRHPGTGIASQSRLLYSLATTIGRWIALLLSIAYAASYLQHNVHIGMALLAILFALLLVVVGSTSRYIYLRSLRKGEEEAGHQ